MSAPSAPAFPLAVDALAADAEALLARFGAAAHRGAASGDDEGALAVAVAECESLRAALDPVLATLAGGGVPASALASVLARAREAAAAHGRLAQCIAARRDRIADALAQLDRPDRVADAYASMAGAPLSTFVR